MGTKVKKLVEYEGISDTLPEYANNVGAFKELMVNTIQELPLLKPDIEQLIKVKVEVVIEKTKIINNPTSESLEGNILTGWKLCVQGMLIFTVEYVADELTQPVHAAHFSYPLCSFIILPESIEECNVSVVTPYIEDINATVVSKREIFFNVLMLLDYDVT